MAVGFALSVVATCAQRRYVVQVHEGYAESTSFWSLTVAPSGSRKSAIKAALVAPLEAWEKWAGDRMRREIAGNNARIAVAEATVKRLQAQAGKAENQEERDHLRKQIEEELAAMPEQLYPPRAYVNESTVERVQTVLTEQRGRCAALSDEGGLLNAISSNYGGAGGPSLDVLLQAYTGCDVRVERVSRKAYVSRAAVTLGLMLQPDLLNEAAGSNKFKASGLMARFPELSRGLIEQGAGIEQARAAILDAMDARDQQRSGGSTVSVSMTRAESSQRALIENTLVAAFGGRPDGDVIRSTDVAGLAARSLQMQGASVGVTESRDRIIQRAMHTTSDFPALLGNAVGRVLQAIYAEIQAPLKTVARLSNLQDFRSRSVVRLGGAPSLERVNESGEFAYGTVDDMENGWRLSTYGRIIALSRQAMVNDDLQGFSTLLQKFAQAAARREADELAAILLTPSLVDGSALFHADRSSLVDKKLTLAGLGDAVKALRLQKEEDGGLILQEPANLVVPVALEMTARQLVASFAAVTADTVQPYHLNVVVEPRLDASSATAWYLVAGNQSALEYGYLDGAQGVQIIQREGFEVDGLEIKARLDFGCGWVSPIGWVKSTGTVD